MFFMGDNTSKRRMRWQLRTWIGEYEDTHPNEKLTYERMERETGLSKTILNRIGKNNAQRADIDTLEALIIYFSEKLGRKLTTNDILKFE